MEEFYYPSEVARLVLGYLDDIKCENSWRVFIEECEDLQEHYRLYNQGRVCSTNVRGESLLEILDSYCVLKSFFDQVISQNSWKSFLKDIQYLQKQYCAYKNVKVCPSSINGKSTVDFLKKWTLKVINKSNACPSCTCNINQVNFLYPDSDLSEKSPVDHHNVQIQTGDRQNTAESTTQTEEVTCHSPNSTEGQLQQITETDAVCPRDNDHRTSPTSDTNVQNEQRTSPTPNTNVQNEQRTSPTSNTNVQNEQRTSNAEKLLNESPVVKKRVFEPSINHGFREDQSSQHSRFQLSPLQTPDKNGQNRVDEDCVHNENEQEASNSNQLAKRQISELSKDSPFHGGLSRDRLQLLSYFTPKKSKRNWTETEMTPLRKNLAQIHENLNESPLGKVMELAETPFKLDPVGNMILANVKDSPEYNAFLTLMSASKVNLESNLLTSPCISNMDTDNCSVDEEADHVNEIDDVEAPFNDADNVLNSAVKTVDLCEEMSVPNPSTERNDSTAVILNKENNSNHELPLETFDKTESTLLSTNFNKEACMESQKLDQNVNNVSSLQSISNTDKPDTHISQINIYPNVAQVCASNLIVQNSSNSNVANGSTNPESHTETNFEEQTALIDNISANVDNLSDCLAENSASKESGKNVPCNSKSNVPQELQVSSDSQTHVTPHDSTTSLNNNFDKTARELVLQSDKKDGNINQNISVNVSQQPVSQSNNSANVAKTSDSQHVTLPDLNQQVVVQPNQANAVISYPSIPAFVMQNYSVDPMNNNIEYRIILNPLNTPITWNASGFGNLCIPTQALPAVSVLNQRVIAPATNEVKRINAENAAQNASRKATNPAPSRKKGGKLPVSSSNCDQNVNIRLPDKSPLKSRKEDLSISSDDFSHNPDIPILLPDKTPVKNNNGPSTSNEPTCSPSVKSSPVTKSSPPKRIERERSVSPRSNLRRQRDHWRMVTATGQTKKYTKPKKKPKKSPKSKADKKETSSKPKQSYALRSKKKSTSTSSKKSTTSSPKKSSASPSKKSKKTPAKSTKEDIPVLSIPESLTSTAKNSATEILSSLTNQFEKELQSPVLKMLVSHEITVSSEDNASNASHVRCLNFGSKPPENTNVGQNNTKKKKKVVKDKPVAESLDKKPATKKKKIKTSNNSNSKISEKKKKSKKCSGTTLQQNGDSGPKSIDTIPVECVVLNNEPCAKIQHESDVQIRNKKAIPDFIAVEEHDVNIDVEEHDLNIDEEHDVNIDEEHDVNIDKEHDVNIDEEHDVNIDEERVENIDKEHVENIDAEEHNVNIDIEKSNAKVAIEDSVVYNNVDENNSKIVESTECHVPTTDERTMSNIEVSKESITQVIYSKQKKEFKKNSSPCRSRKGSPKIFQKAQNKRKMRPPKKRVKSDNLHLSVIDKSVFNLNSYESSGSQLGGVESTSKSILPFVQKSADYNSCDYSEDIEVVDLCEEDHISSAPSCSTTKSKPQSPSTVDNIGCQKIMGNTSVPVDNQKQTKNTANELTTYKLQKTSPGKSHQLDSSLASVHQEQPSTLSYPPIPKSDLAQFNKHPSKKMDVELPISSADSTHHIYFPPENAMPQNSKISGFPHSDLNEKNISSQCRTENETSDPEMAVSRENSNLQPSTMMDVELPISSANSTHHIYFPPENAMPQNSEISGLPHSDLNEKIISSQCRTENERSDAEMAISRENDNLLSSYLLKNTFVGNKMPFKKRVRPPFLSSFGRYKISNTTLLKLKEDRAMKVSHSGSLTIKQSDPSDKKSAMDKDKCTSSSNLASSAETDCLQFSNTSEVSSKPDKFSKLAESYEQMHCENIIEKSTARETDGISENITSNVNCLNEMPVDMDVSFRGRKRRLSDSSCELQIVLNESMASSVNSSPFVAKKKRSCKLPSSSEESPSSSPQKRKEVISQNDHVLPENKGHSSPLQSYNLNEIAENNINEGACNQESNLNLKKLQDSPVRCISKKKAVHKKSAFCKKIEKDPTIPAGVKIPSKWNNSKIETYSSAIRVPADGDKKIGKGKKQAEKKTKQPVDASKTVTFKSVKMKLNGGKQGVSKKLFPETVEKDNACNDNKLTDFLFEDKKINNAYVLLNKLNCDEIDNTMLSQKSNDNFQQTSNETALNNKITGATLQSRTVNVTDDSENFKDIVESDIGMSSEKDSELATAIAACEIEMHKMQSNQCSPSPKKNNHAQASSKENGAASTGSSFSSQEEKWAFLLSLTEKIDEEQLLSYLD